MRVYPFDVRQALLDSAKEEFLRSGFRDASLRQICSRAGVTTGAFYSYFDKKEDLFSSIVDPVIEEFSRNCRDIVELRSTDDYTNGDSEMRSVEFMLSHRDEFLLLFDGSEGTVYEDFQEKVLNSFMFGIYRRYIDLYAGRPVDPDLVDILLRMKSEEYRQLLYGSYTMETTRKLVRNLCSFTEAGFERLLEVLQDEDS